MRRVEHFRCCFAARLGQIVRQLSDQQLHRAFTDAAHDAQGNLVSDLIHCLFGVAFGIAREEPALRSAERRTLGVGNGFGVQMRGLGIQQMNLDQFLELGGTVFGSDGHEIAQLVSIHKE